MRTWLARLGLALARPRAALAVAGDRRHAGRSGSDLLLAIAMLIVATQLRAIVGAVWLGAVVDAALGARALVQVLQGALTIDLGILVVAAAIVFLAGGPRRELGRAFDLACVAIVPIVVVELAVVVIARGLEVDVPAPAGYSLAGAVGAWTCALVALAVVEMRRTGGGNASGAEGARAARRVGVAIIACAVAGIAVETRWLVVHSDLVRPLTAGHEAPAFVLPSIGPGGALAAPVALADERGKIVIVDFWAPWCGPCRDSLPHLDALARKHPEIAVIAIDLEDFAGGRELFDANHYTMTLVADDQATSARFGVGPIPHTVIIDRGGIVRRVMRGRGADLEAEIAALER